MSHRVAVIQVWRFVAALGVLVAHAHSRSVQAFPGTSVVPSCEIGAAGVDVFFVISGFIMTWTCWDRFETTPFDFWRRRIARIAPTYWIATSLLLVCPVVLPVLFPHGGPPHDVPWRVASYLFIPWPSPAEDGFTPVLAVGWTLVYEAYFYLVFGLALLFSRTAGLALVSVFFIFSAVLGSTVGFDAYALQRYASWLPVEFCLGMAVAALVRAGARARPGLLCALTAVALGTVALTPVTAGDHLARFVGWGIPAALLIYCSLHLPPVMVTRGALGRALVALGDATYSTYVFHLLALPALVALLRLAGLRYLHTDVATVALVAGAVAVGWACYRVIEVPVTRAAQALLIRPLCDPNATCDKVLRPTTTP